MVDDVLVDTGYLFLGSRLKRLAERFQADAAMLLREGGLPIQPAHFPLLAALERYGPLTVSRMVDVLGLAQPTVTRTATALVDLGLVEVTRRDTDQRVKTLDLTDTGRRLVEDARKTFWPRVEQAVAMLCDPLSGALLEQMDGLEAGLDRASFAERVRGLPAGVGMASGPVRICTFRDTLADDFYRISEEWILDMFGLEEADLALMRNPRKAIVDPGGDILFAEVPDLGVVGTCALLKADDGCFELSKMGVLRAARGRKVGDILLLAALDRAGALGAETLYLLTNRKCEAAIRLYEKAGFEHDAEIMATYGARYERCNVAMRYRGRFGEARGRMLRTG